MKISVMAMAYTLLISGLISQIINAWPNKKLLGYSYLAQVKDILPSIIISFLMGIIVYTINIFNINVILKLIIQIIVGGITYLSMAKLLKIDSLEYIIGFVGSLKNKIIK